jgi:hypothetical protein
MALSDEDALDALDALLYSLAAGAQPRYALYSRVLARATRRTPDALPLTSYYACSVRADRTAAPPAWRAPRTSSTRSLRMVRCEAALRAPFAWLGSPGRAPCPSAGLEWPSLRAGVTWRRSWQRSRRRWTPARSARSRARRAPRRVAAGPAGPRSTGARARPPCGRSGLGAGGVVWRSRVSAVPVRQERSSSSAHAVHCAREVAP